MDEPGREQAEKLAQLITKHKGTCTAYIDNDSWHLMKDVPEEWDDLTDEQQDAWYTTEGVIAESIDYPDLGIVHGYGILEALAFAAGLKLEGV